MIPIRVEQKSEEIRMAEFLADCPDGLEQVKVGELPFKSFEIFIFDDKAR